MLQLSSSVWGMYILEDFLPTLMATAVVVTGRSAKLRIRRNDPSTVRTSETGGIKCRIVRHRNNTNGEYRLQVEYNA